MKWFKLQIICLSLLLAAAVPVHADQELDGTDREIRRMETQADRAQALRSPGHQQRINLNEYSMSSVRTADHGSNWNWLGLLGLLGLAGFRRRNRERT